MTHAGLAAAPTSFIDPRTREPAFGAYEGALPAIVGVDLGVFTRVARRKKWVYAAFASDEIWMALAVVRTGYAATAFAFAYDLRDKTMIADETALAPPLASRVADDHHASGDIATFAFGRSRVAMTRSGDRITMNARVGAIAMDVSLDESSAPPPISAIGLLEGGPSWDATEKRALVRVTGRATCGGRAFALDGATGGYDYTHGVMPRHTKWRWGFALGRAGGEPLAFNVVQGFVGKAECAAFTSRGVHPLPEPRFVFDEDKPLEPWRLAADGVDLVFTPGAMHAQTTKLVVVRSRFVQPVGTFRGKLRVDGRDLELDDVPGVVENQDVLW